MLMLIGVLLALACFSNELWLAWTDRLRERRFGLLHWIALVWLIVAAAQKLLF